MKLHHYFAIGIKLFAIALYIYGLRYIGPIIEIFRTGSLNSLYVNDYFFSINLVVTWAIALVLWMHPVALAKMFLSKELDLEVEPMATPMIMATLVAGIGLFVFCHGAIDIMYWAVNWYLVSNNDAYVSNPDMMGNTVATIFQLLFSSLMIIKCRTIASYINKVAT